MSTALIDVWKTVSEIIRPPPQRTASGWADSERILPPESPEPGPWRSDRIPYFIPVMDAFSDNRYKMVVGACGSQMGKSEIAFNVVGHRMDDGPYVPALFIGPTEKMVRSISKDRFQKMIKSSAGLTRKLEGGRRDSVMEKFFSGVRFGFAWAGSATELASHPAGLVLIDEVDRMLIDVGQEGDPILLAQARTKNYSDSKIGIFSTPTIEGISPIWRYFENGTMGKWEWPCPHCSTYFVPEFKNLRWPENETPEDALYSTRLVCPHCGAELESHHKETMNAAGRYLFHVKRGDKIEPVGNEPPRNPTASYWVSGLCSPWQTFGEIANVMLTALRSRNPATIQAATNTYCGELFRQAGEAPRWQDVAVLRGDYLDRPSGVQFITVGVDVQKLGLYYVVRGWGFNSESWRLAGGYIPGQTEYDNVWILLTRIIDADYNGMKPKCVFVDSGYRPGDRDRRPDHMVYKYARQFSGLVWPTKGRDKLDAPIMGKKIDVTLSGKTHRAGLQLWHIDTDYYKSWLHSRIKWPEGEPGGFHLERTCDDDYCKQMTAEEVLTLPSGRRVWRKLREDNHYLDCEVNAAAAASKLQVHTLKDPKAIPKPTKPAPPPQNNQRRPATKRRGIF